jgi:hypothetical protein
MLVANLVADGEMFAFDKRRGGIVGDGEKGFVDGAAGGDGAGDDVANEITA